VADSPSRLAAKSRPRLARPPATWIPQSSVAAWSTRRAPSRESPSTSTLRSRCSDGRSPDGAPQQTSESSLLRRRASHEALPTRCTADRALPPGGGLSRAARPNRHDTLRARTGSAFFRAGLLVERSSRLWPCAGRLVAIFRLLHEPKPRLHSRISERRFFFQNRLHVPRSLRPWPRSPAAIYSAQPLTNRPSTEHGLIRSESHEHTLRNSAENHLPRVLRTRKSLTSILPLHSPYACPCPCPYANCLPRARTKREDSSSRDPRNPGFPRTRLQPQREKRAHTSCQIAHAPARLPPSSVAREAEASECGRVSPFRETQMRRCPHERARTRAIAQPRPQF
jgi:hypothetical protein